MHVGGRGPFDGMLGPRDHFCCVYDDPAGYHRRLAEFFADGLREGLRILYAGPGNVEALRGDLGGLTGLDQLLVEDTVRLVSFEELYGPGGRVDPPRVIATCAEATEEALTDGYRGLRVSADVTELVRTPEQQSAFAQYEFLLGPFMAQRPMSAMCAYRADLGGDILTDFASLHDAAAPPGLTSFQVFVCDDGALGLSGEFDVSCAMAFKRILALVRPQAGAASLVVDMAGVRYVDHRVLLTLNGFALANRIKMLVRSAPPIVSRLIELLSTGGLQLAEMRSPP